MPRRETPKDPYSRNAGQLEVIEDRLGRPFDEATLAFTLGQLVEVLKVLNDKVSMLDATVGRMLPP